MNREYNSRVSSKNSERLLKNLKNTTGVYFFLPHPVGYSVMLKLTKKQVIEVIVDFVGFSAREERTSICLPKNVLPDCYNYTETY